MNVGELQGSLGLDVGPVARAFAQLEAMTRRAESGFQSATRTTQTFDRELGRVPETAKRVLEAFTGFSLARGFEEGIGKIRQFISESRQLGLEAKTQEAAFAAMTRAVGISGDELLRSLQRVSGGILNESDVMQAAVRAMQEGLDPTQIVRLMEIARQSAKVMGTDVSTAFNAITEAIANQQTRALKQMGIVIDLDDAMQKYAQSTGTSADALTIAGRAQALFNAVAEKGAPLVHALSTEALTQREIIERAGAEWKQFKEDIGKALVDAQVAVLRWVGDLKPALDGVKTALMSFADGGKTAVDAIHGLVSPVAELTRSLLGTEAAAKAASIALYGLGAATTLAAIGGLVTLLRVGVVGALGLIAAHPAFAAITALVTLAVVAKKGYEAMDAGIRSGVTDQQKLNDLLAEQAMLVKQLQDNPGAQGLLDRLKAVQDEIIRTQAAAGDATRGSREGAAGPVDRTAAAILPKPALVDPVKQALHDVDLAQLKLRADLDAGRIGADQYAAGLNRLAGQLEPLTGKSEEALKRFVALRKEITDLGLASLEQSFEQQKDAIAAGAEITTAGINPEQETALFRQAEEARLKAVEQMRAELEVAMAGAGEGAEVAFAQGQIDAAAAQRGRILDVQKSLADESGAVQLAALQDYIRARQEFLDADVGSDAQREAVRLQIFRASLDKRLAELRTGLAAETELVIAKQHEIAAAMEQLATAGQRSALAVARTQVAAAQLSGDAWGVFVGTLQMELLQLPTFFQEVQQAAVTVFTGLHDAFKDSFVSLFHGDLDGLKNAWKAFLDKLIDLLASFLASEAVKLFFELLGMDVGGGGVSINVGGGGSGGGVTVGGVNVGSTGSSAGNTVTNLGTSLATSVITSKLASWISGGSTTSLSQAVWNYAVDLVTGAAPPVAATTGTTITPAVADTSALSMGFGTTGATAAGGGFVFTGATEAGAAAALTGAEGGATAAALGAGTAAGGSGSAATGTAMAPAVPFLALAAPVALFLAAYLTNRKTPFDAVLAKNVQQMGQFQQQLAQGIPLGDQLSAAILTGVEAVQQFGRFQSGGGFHEGMPFGAPNAPLMDIDPNNISPYTLERIKKIYGDNAEAVVQVIAQQTAAVRAAAQQQVQAIIAGQATVTPFTAPELGGGGDAGDRLTALAQEEQGLFQRQAAALMTAIPGTANLSGPAFQGLTAQLEQAQGNFGALQAIVEAIERSLGLSTDNAVQLVQNALASAQAFQQTADATTTTQTTLDGVTQSLTTGGEQTRTMAEAAQGFAVALAGGTAPADQLQGAFGALAGQYGPAFTDAVMGAVDALGLGQEAADGLLGLIQQMAETEITIPVTFNVGPAPNVPGGGAPEPQDSRLHGGWIHARLLAGGWITAAGGAWVPGGTWGADHVPALLDGGEYVVQAPAAARYPGFLERFNADPDMALAGVRSGGRHGDGPILAVTQPDPEDRAMMREQNALLREQNALLRQLATRGSQRPRGDAWA